MHLDSHQHFWKYSPAHHVWMTDRMEVLRRDYLPAEFEPLLQSIQFEGSIAVQARQVIDETDWLLDLADQHSFIKGVVGWVDLRASNLQDQLERYRARPKLVGVRHVIHDEPDLQFMLGAEFRRGISQLERFGLTYDLLLFPRHLPIASTLVEEFPRQPFVLDHIGKPDIGNRELLTWRKNLKSLARHENVFCKLSGMVTEAPWKQWRPADFRPYFDEVMDAFGPERLMIGSDWPVCTLSGDYITTMQLVLEYLGQFPQPQQQAILGGNCSRFYRIPERVNTHEK